MMEILKLERPEFNRLDRLVDAAEKIGEELERLNDNLEGDNE